MLAINYTEDDIVQASRLHFSRGWKRKVWLCRLLTLLYVVVFALILWRLFQYFQDYQYYLWYFSGHTGFALEVSRNLLILAFLGILPCYLRWLVTLTARKHYRQSKALQQTIHYQWDDHSLYASSENGQVKTPWENIIRQEENPDTLLLYTSDIAYSTFPKRCFPNEALLNDFRQHAPNAQSVSAN